MPCVSLQRKSHEFQEESSDLEMQLLELGFLCEDAAGNIAQIDDAAQQTIFFNGSVVSPSQKFEYDALYRLVKATGREHVSVNADGEPEAEGYNAAQISPQDGSAMRNYSREWEYDSVGNILSMIHKFNGSQWTRRNAYATDSNRLNSTAVGQTTASFAYNAHGSMTSMPHLSAMDWDFAEKLCHVTRGTTEAYYNYDGSGIRTRKVVVKNGVTETRLYLGGFEIWRKTVNGVLDTERETLHVMDDQRRIALVETLTVENGNRVAAPAPVQRYQLDNHLGSASLELDESANVISYEEYYPYGDTSYRAGRSASEVSQKRYRYTGKEKDEESGLYYHGARYYACWLGRWTAVDPIGIGDGLNVYMYVQGNPVKLQDPNGTEAQSDDVQMKTLPKVKKKESLANESNGSEIFSNLSIKEQDKIWGIMYKGELTDAHKKLIRNMVLRHISMVCQNKENDKEKKEITVIGDNLNTAYIGFYNEERKTHTMGTDFTNLLNNKTELFKSENPDGHLFVFHLHPVLTPKKAEYVNKLKESDNARTMFSVEGDHDVMKENQIWIGIEIFPEKDGTYTYDVHASQKELGARSVLLYSDTLDLNKFPKLKNKCFHKVFKKEVQMTK